MNDDRPLSGFEPSPDDVIDAVYEGALEPSEYIKLFEAWDKFFLDPATNESAATDVSSMRGRELEPHFRRAGRIFDLTLQSQANDIQADLDEMKYAAFAIGSDGKITASNEPAKTSFIKLGLEAIFDFTFHADTETRVRSFLRDQSLGKINNDAQLCVTGNHLSSGQNLVFVIELIHQGDGGAVALVKTTSVSWNQENERLLISAFGFTPAETDIVQAMVNGYSLAEIALQRNRSLSTIRTQIKMMLQKTGLGSQKELLRLVTSICFILDERPSSSSITVGSTVNTDICNVVLDDGRTVSYVTTGPPSGKPILFLQPTTRPDFTPRLREALIEKDLYIVSPVRPGSWGVSALEKNATVDALIEDYAALVETLGLNLHAIVGYCSGGIYAAKLANRLKDRVDRVILIDTGAPLDSIAKIRAMPRIERRTFLTARLFPPVLLVPHRLIAADFRRSARGERKTVDYFYADSPHDKALMSDPEYYSITRDNIAYCFENVPQLVSDVILWAQDWSRELEELARHASVHFVHGSENAMFKSEDILAIASKHVRIRCTIIADAGQTLIYAHPERVAALIVE